MTRDEASKRFNLLPIEHRVTIIGNELDQEIKWLAREKTAAIEAHKKNISRINDRITRLEKALSELKDNDA